MKRIRDVIITLLVGILISSTVPAFAAVGDKVTAIFVSHNLFMNGNQISTNCEQLDVGGTTYVPLRCFANTFGWDVTYKSADDGIYFSGGETVTGATYTISGMTPQAKAEKDAMGQRIDDLNATYEAIGTKQREIRLLQRHIKTQQNTVNHMKEVLANPDGDYLDKDQITQAVLDQWQAKLIDMQSQLATAQAELADLQIQQATLEKKSWKDYLPTN